MHLQSPVALTSPAGDITDVDAENDIAVPFVPLCPAAMRTILPVFCILNMVAVSVLPSIATSLTLPGLNVVTLEQLCMILLTRINGDELSYAVRLWTKTLVVLVLGLLEHRIAASFASRLFKMPSIEFTGACARLLDPIDETVFAMAIPPRILQVTILILRTATELLPRTIATPPPVDITRLAKLTNETPSPAFGVIPSAKPLLRLATAFAFALLMTISVLTTGLFALLSIALATALRRRALSLVVMVDVTGSYVKSSDSITGKVTCERQPAHPTMQTPPAR